MKIAILTPGFSGGGAEVIAINSANYYHKQGHKVTFYSFNESGLTRCLLQEDIRVNYIHPGNYFSFTIALAFQQLYYDHQ